MQPTNTIPVQNEQPEYLLKQWVTPEIVEIEILANNPFNENDHPLGS